MKHKLFSFYCRKEGRQHRGMTGISSTHRQVTHAFALRNPETDASSVLVVNISGGLMTRFLSSRRPALVASPSWGPEDHTLLLPHIVKECGRGPKGKLTALRTWIPLAVYEKCHLSRARCHLPINSRVVDWIFDPHFRVDRALRRQQAGGRLLFLRRLDNEVRG